MKTAFLGLWIIGNIASTPSVGNDTTQGDEAAFYRRLVALVLENTVRKGWMLNYAADAGEIRSREGGQGEVEYNTIFCHHLTTNRRAACRAWASIVNRYFFNGGLPANVFTSAGVCNMFHPFE